jgi:hypothetical protein
MSDDLRERRRYAIYEENVELAPVFIDKGQSKEDKVDTGNILSNAFQIAAIVVSIAFLYGVQRFMSMPIEGDEKKRAIMNQARALKREARQRSLEILKASSELDFPLSTASSLTGKDEQARGSRATRKRLSREEELRSSVTELSGRHVAASGETQGNWGTAQSCG